METIAIELIKQPSFEFKNRRLAFTHVVVPTYVTEGVQPALTEQLGLIGEAVEKSDGRRMEFSISLRVESLFPEGAGLKKNFLDSDFNGAAEGLLKYIAAGLL